MVPSGIVPCWRARRLGVSGGRWPAAGRGQLGAGLAGPVRQQHKRACPPEPGTDTFPAGQ